MPKAKGSLLRSVVRLLCICNWTCTVFHVKRERERYIYIFCLRGLPQGQIGSNWDVTHAAKLLQACMASMMNFPELHFNRVPITAVSEHFLIERRCSSERPETWKLIFCSIFNVGFPVPVRYSILWFLLTVPKTYKNHALAEETAEHALYRTIPYDNPESEPSVVGQSIPWQSPERPQPRCLLGWPAQQRAVQHNDPLPGSCPLTSDCFLSLQISFPILCQLGNSILDTGWVGRKNKYYVIGIAIGHTRQVGMRQPLRCPRVLHNIGLWLNVARSNDYLASAAKTSTCNLNLEASATDQEVLTWTWTVRYFFHFFPPLKLKCNY